MFQYQTIAEAAAVAVPVTAPAAAAAAGGEPVPAPLTPNQAAFLAHAVEPDGFTQSLWADLAIDVDLPTLRRALDALVRHHDALRLRVERTPDGWRQSVSAAVPVRLDVLQLDTAGTAESDRDAVAERHALALESTVDVGEGRMLVASVVDAGAAGRSLLLLAHTTSRWTRCRGVFCWKTCRRRTSSSSAGVPRRPCHPPR